MLKNEPYGREVDLWSLGVILYILLCGFPPFYHENTAQLYKQIKKGEYDFPDPYWTEISDSGQPSPIHVLLSSVDSLILIV